MGALCNVVVTWQVVQKSSLLDIFILKIIY